MNRQRWGPAPLLLLLLSLAACAPSVPEYPVPSAGTTPVPSVQPLFLSPVLPTPLPTPQPAPEPTPEAPAPLPEPYNYSQPAPENDPVDVEWFADAVFVGDSRTDGLRLYSGIKGSHFICYKGMTADEFDDRVCIADGEGKITALQALKKANYAKVFVMLGLNELGYPPETFAQDYAQLIDQVRAAQPDAALYFQSIVPINPRKAKERNQPYYVTNEHIAAFNAEIVRLCEEKQVIFLDVAAGLTDEEGVLPYDCAIDGIHFTKAWYQEWFSYLCTHTVDPALLAISSPVSDLEESQ